MTNKPIGSIKPNGSKQTYKEGAVAQIQYADNKAKTQAAADAQRRRDA